LNHKFRFAAAGSNGDNDVTASVTIPNANTLIQHVAITQDGVRYFFNMEYRLDGSDDFSATITHESCSKSWTGAETTDGNWRDCGEISGLAETSMQLLTSFEDAYVLHWTVPDADVRTWVWTNLLNTSYKTYIDFDSKKFVGEFL